MTDDEINERFERSRDEGASVALALIEVLNKKQHSTGAIRTMAPYLTDGEVKRVIALSGEILRQRVLDRKKEREAEAQKIVVPGSGLLVPPGNLPR